MTSTPTPSFLAFGMAVGIAASVIGFTACAVLWGHARRMARTTPAMMIDYSALYSWGTIFFGGIALLLVQLLMGKNALIPMPEAADLPLVVTTPIQLWALVCVAGMAAGKAWKVHKRFQFIKEHPVAGVDRRTPLRTVLGIFVMFGLCVSLMGGAACGPSGPLSSRTMPEMAGEAETYKAVAPHYLELIRSESIDAQTKALYVRTVQTWYDRLAVELQGDPTYGQGHLQPDDAAIYTAAGIPAPANIAATTRSASGT